MRTQTQRDRERVALRTKRELQRQFEDEFRAQQSLPGIFGQDLIEALAQAAYGGSVVDDDATAGLPVSANAPAAVRRAELAWATQGAALDTDTMRQIDRTRFGGILPPDTKREDDGWVPVTTLWECTPEATRGKLTDPGHAPFCNCEVWDNGFRV